MKEATSQASKDSVATSQSAAPAAQSEAPAASATAKPKASVEKAASQAPDAVAKSEANSTLAADQGKVNKGYAGFRKAGQSGFRSAGQQTEGKTTVTKEDFPDYFNLNGSATYNSQDGIVTLTPDETSKGGNFSLKSKINMNQKALNWLVKLTSVARLKHRVVPMVSVFAFHTGNTDDLGALGGNLGIGGLRNATGFKLDTFWNPYAQPKGERFNTNDTTFFQYGWAEDPKNIGSQFGAWVNTTLKKRLKETAVNMNVGGLIQIQMMLRVWTQQT